MKLRRGSRNILKSVKVIFFIGVAKQAFRECQFPSGYSPEYIDVISISTSVLFKGS